MDSEGLRRMLARDWSRLRAGKARAWAERTPRERLEAAWALREHLRAVQPGWPSERDRAADLAHHVEQRRLYARLGDLGL